jgi:hypothetical protein
MSKFVSTRNKGFFMEFENGFGISVQYGTENYCEKKNTTINPTDPMEHTRWDSLSAEIAVFEGEEMINISSDGVDAVIGWLGTDDVAKIIAIVSSSKSAEEIQTKVKKLGL